MRPPIEAEIEPRLGYPNMIGAYSEALSASFDVEVHEIFGKMQDMTAIHGVNLDKGIRLGTISVMDIIKINDTCFDGHPFKITHKLRLYDSGQSKHIKFASDAVVLSTRNYFHELEIVKHHHLMLYELNLPITLRPIDEPRYHPQELFLWLENTIREIDQCIPGEFSSAYGTFEFEDPYSAVR